MNRLSWEEIIDNDTSPDEWNAIYTIQLGELIETGVFDWSMDSLDWSEAAYSPEQFHELCKYFEQRFYFREISIEPFYEWAFTLKRKIVYEIMPKYRHLYERIAQGVNPLQDAAEYEKRRVINSEYPETLLSGNSDYLSTGMDSEYDRIKEGNLTESLQAFKDAYEPVNQLICDELECMFICLYTANVNGF